jgi:Fungal Zn(2)-Cys(6) binuclear cluster domain
MLRQQHQRLHLRRQRLACDRCHGQKLRCIKHDGNNDCVRCIKAEVSCDFSPRLRRGTSNKANRPACDDSSDVTTTGDSLADLGDIATPSNRVASDRDLESNQREEVGFDIGQCSEDSRLFDMSLTNWPTTRQGLPSLDSLGGGVGFDFGSLGIDLTNPLLQDLPSPWPLDSGEFSTSTNQEWQGVVGSRGPGPETPKTPFLDPSIQEPPVSKVHYVRQLAELNIGLYDHAAALPPKTTNSTNNASKKAPTKGGKRFAIDQTFHLTQTLIDILSRLYPHTSNDITFSPKDNLPQSQPDQGTILLILSCYNRVMDIYEVIFHHMQGCIRHSITPTMTDGQTITLPPVRIGSFAPSDTSAIAIQMMLIIMLASRLFDQLQDVVGVSVGEGANGNSGEMARTHPDFSDTARTHMWNRASGMSKQIMSTRKMLMIESGSTQSRQAWADA